MPFKQRTVVDPSTRLFREAEVQLQQDTAAIRDQERQDQTQIAALKNADIQLTNNEIYFLKAHDKMWNAIMSTLGPKGPVQSAYVDWGRAQAGKGAIEGNDEYDEDEDNTPDTRVTSALKLEQNIQGANAKIASQQSSNVKSGELWAEKNHWYKSGAQRAYAARTAADFQIDLPSYLESSEDELTYTNSKGEHIPFQVKNYQDIKGTPKPYSVAVREYAAQRIAQAVESGLAPDFVAEKIVPLINKQASTAIKTYNLAWNKADAWEQISKARDMVYDSINLGITPLEETIVAQREVIAAQMGRLDKEKPYIETDKELSKIIWNAAKAKHARKEDFQADLDAIQKIKFKFPWLKEAATLGEAKPEDWAPEVFASKAREIKRNLFDELEKDKQVNASAGLKKIEALEQDPATNPRDLADAKADWIHKYATDFPKLYADLLDKSDLKMGTKHGFAWANQLIKDNEKMSFADLSRLNPESIAMLDEKHGDRDRWLEEQPIEERISEDGMKAAKDIIDGGLNQVLERATKLDAENGTVARVEQYVYKQIGRETRAQIRLAKLNGEDLSNNIDEAARRAATAIEKKLLEANADPTATHMLSATPTEGFKFFDTKAGTHRVQSEIAQGAQVVKSAQRMREENYVLKDPLLSIKLDNIPQSAWELTSSDELKPIWRHLGAISGTNPVEIYRQQAQLHQIQGLKEPKVWEGQELINDKIDGNVIKVVLKNAENSKALSNGIDNAGGVSPVTLGSALFGTDPERIASWTEEVKASGKANNRQVFIRWIASLQAGYKPGDVDEDNVPIYRSNKARYNGMTLQQHTVKTLKDFETGGLLY